MKKLSYFFGLFFALAFFVLLGVFFRLLQEKNFLEEKLIKIQTPIIKNTVNVIEPKSTFLVKNQSEDYDILNLEKIKNELLSKKESFVEVDLEKMKISLYKDGNLFQTFSVLSKGKEGSWWETPTGYYTITSKSLNLFSSIGGVWMPYSMQFYGNFFIHGWPYYPNGTAVSRTYSGGCIRLADKDAKEVFNFVKLKTPVLVFDKDVYPKNLEPFNSREELIFKEDIFAESFLIADLDTGEIVLEKNADLKYPIASITKLMTAVVASELIYLDKNIKITSGMLSDAIQSHPLEVGKYYNAFDLLYPLLMKSSNGAARALGAFLGENFFVDQMNKKAQSLLMKDTNFKDPAGISEENVSTLKDIAKLFKYILDKRKFIFDISIGKKNTVFGKGEFLNIENFNEFVGDKNLVGVKNGQTKEAFQTIGTVWRFFDRLGNERYVFIGVLKSKDRKKDTEKLLNWFKENIAIKINKEE
jgi:D-alanyl-D-alanine carboxypeptidase